MPATGDDSQAYSTPPAQRTTSAARRGTAIGLGVVLVVGVYLAGSPALQAPWLQGDEHIFIVNNPEVTGAGVVDDSAWTRLKLIFRFPPVEDLYQPLPILTYAVEWTLWGPAAESIRRTDVLLHALNALLLWWVLRRLLARASGGDGEPALRTVLSWSLALVWALHPALTSAWAGDMGRTHLLSAMFALLSLGLHLRSLEPGRWYLFAGAAAALVAAMLCKVIPGWVLLVLVLEVTLCGWRRALLSCRVYVVGVVCVGFAAAAYWTSQLSGIVEDASAGLFGDPVSRSALAVWIYTRDLVAPFWLSWWHLPDPRTGWANPLVWLGLTLGAASVVHAVWAWLQRRRGVAIGWAWCWALLLPVIGLVGAREAAAVDRYLYQPLMGIVLVIGVVVLRRITKPSASEAAASARRILLVTALLGAGLLLWDLPHVKTFRSTLRRARRVVALNPGDPRALEALAAACDFNTNHRLPADDLGDPPRFPDRQAQYRHFLTQTIATLRQAAGAENLEHYFPGPDDRAPFHRRLSYKLKTTHQYEDSLAQAQIARQLQPDAFLTWLRLAHAYQGLKRWDEAVAAYNRCEELLPDDPRTRATHYTDFGYLLLFDLERADLARGEFQAAIDTGRAPTLAQVGLARCEIRVGEGARGHEIIMRVLATDQNNALAGLVLAEYYLRSRKLEQAANVYRVLLATYPGVYRRFDWFYEALRGYQSVCAQLGRWREAALAWDQVARDYPQQREFRSFRVWAIACAGEEDVAAWADELLAGDPNNPLACLAHMLRALRAGRVEEAVEWVRKAQLGTPIPRAREFERGVAALQLLSDSGKLPPEATILEATILLTRGGSERGRALLRKYVQDHPDSRWKELAERLGTEVSDPPDP